MAARTRKTAAKSATATVANETASPAELLQFIQALHKLTGDFLNGSAAVDTDDDADDAEPADEAQTQTRPTRRGKGASKAAPEPEEDEDDAEGDDDDEAPAGPGKTEAQLKKMKLPALKKLAKEYFDDEAVDDAEAEDLIESLLSLDADEDEDGEDADDADADEDEDGEEDDDELQAELEALTIGELRKKARDEYEATAAELKGLDKDGIISLILDTETEDDADADVESDDDEEGYTQDELEAMDTAALKEICDEWEIEYTPRARAAKLIEMILEAQDEEEE